MLNMHFVAELIHEQLRLLDEEFPVRLTAGPWHQLTKEQRAGFVQLVEFVARRKYVGSDTLHRNLLDPARHPNGIYSAAPLDLDAGQSSEASGATAVPFEIRLKFETLLSLASDAVHSTAAQYVLMSALNPGGAKLEVLLERLIKEIQAKTDRIAEVDTDAARRTRINNLKIIGSLTQALAAQLDTLRVLESVGPDQGPLGAPRIGGGEAAVIKVPAPETYPLKEIPQ